MRNAEADGGSDLQRLLCGGNGAWRSLVARVLWEH